MKLQTNKLASYTANGLVATGIHYAVFYSCVEVFNFQLIGLASFLASIFGITSSFIGNRYFVFNSKCRSISDQFLRFVILYSLASFAQGALLYIWSDVLKKNYNYGFILAVTAQLVLTYIINKHFIFPHQGS